MRSRLSLLLVFFSFLLIPFISHLPVQAQTANTDTGTTTVSVGDTNTDIGDTNVDVGSSNSDVGSTGEKTEEKVSWLDKFLALFGDFFKSFTKPYKINPDNPPSLTDFGDKNNYQDNYDSSTRLTNYQNQIKQKNQYILDVINGTYEDRQLSSCPGDQSPHQVTIKELAFYSTQVNLSSTGLSNLNLSQEETDQLSKDFKDFTADPNLKECYTAIYEQLQNVPQGGKKDAQNAAGSRQLNDNIRLALPYDEQDSPIQSSDSEAGPRDKYTEDNKKEKNKLDNYLSPDGSLKGLNNLRPDGWN